MDGQNAVRTAIIDDHAAQFAQFPMEHAHCRAANGRHASAEAALDCEALGWVSCPTLYWRTNGLPIELDGADSKPCLCKGRGRSAKGARCNPRCEYDLIGWRRCETVNPIESARYGAGAIARAVQKLGMANLDARFADGAYHRGHDYSRTDASIDRRANALFRSWIKRRRGRRRAAAKANGAAQSELDALYDRADRLFLLMGYLSAAGEFGR